MDKKIIYQVLPRLWKGGKFSDWNNESIAYVKSLSADYVWLTGIIRHATNEDWVKGDVGSPFAISDYFDVNPYLADNPATRMKEFGGLVSRLHKGGLKLLMDFVPNHVAKCGASGIPTYDHSDYDWSDTLKINYSDPSTWSKMLEVVLFWAAKGVDGFRCDMVELVPKEFLTWLIAEVKKEYPEVIFIGEIYNRQNYWTFVKDIKFDLIYDKSGMYDTMKAIYRSDMTVKSLTWNWQSLGDELKDNMLNFLENHDEQRFACSEFAGGSHKAFAALAFELLFNNASFMVYFGQEIGENAADCDNGRTSIFDIKRPLAFENPDTQLLERYRNILALSRTPLFCEGRNWDLCYCNLSSPGFNPDSHFAFLRFNESKAILVVCNFSDWNATMQVYIPKETGLAPGSFELNVPAWDYAVLELPV